MNSEYSLYVFNFSASLEIKTCKGNHPFLSVQHLLPCRSRWSHGISTSAARILRSFPSSSRRRCSQPTAWVVPPAWATKTCRERSVLRRRSGMRVVRWMMGDREKAGKRIWEESFDNKFLKLGWRLREFIISKPIQKSYLKIGVVNAHFFPKILTTHNWCKLCIGRSR